MLTYLRLAGPWRWVVDSLLIVFFGVVLVFGLTIFVLIATKGRTSTVLDVEKFRTSWLSVEQQLVKDQSGSYMISVIEADKLLDLALKKRGFSGQTMGERMKSASASWSDANAVWRAHKLRNQLAHEHNVKVDYRQARTALASIRQGLRDLGAI